MDRPRSHAFRGGHALGRLVNVGVVVDRDQIRRPVQTAPYQCPGRQYVMMLINDVDVFSADLLILA